MQHEYRNRLRVVFVTITLVMVLFVYRLVGLQITHAEDYQLLADRQYVTNSAQLFDRGSIFFSDKNNKVISAATIKTGYKVAISPKDIPDPQATYAALSEIVPTLNEEIFLARASKEKDPYEEILFHLDKPTADRIRKKDLVGVRLYTQKWRHYPSEEVGAQTIGFVGSDGSELSGRYGLERFYDSELRRSLESLSINFFAQIFSDMETLLSDTPKENTHLVTTIDPDVQVYLHAQIKEVQERWNADSAGGIIINPKTGAIYAMETTPSFNPNSFGQVEKISTYNNPLVEHVFEMGSIMKPLTVAIGLDLNLISSETKYYDKGSIVVGDYTVYNFDKKGRGWVTVQDILTQSLNTGMVNIMAQLPRKTVRTYLESFGLGTKTKIDLPNESSGITSNLASNREVEFANIAFGQGVALTPMQTVRALSVLANGGRLIQPYLVKEFKFDGGLSKDNRPVQSQELLIRPETSDEITRMLVNVVDTSLHKQETGLDQYSIAAKTGTAQIPNPATGGYYEDQKLHTFFGYFPAYDPEFLVFYYLKGPKGVRYASETLATPFFTLADFLLNYYEVTPDRAGILAQPELPEVAEEQ